MEWNVRFMTAMVALFGSLAIAVVGIWWATSESPPYPTIDRTPLPQVSSQKAPKGAIYVRGTDSMRLRARLDELQEQVRRQERLIAAKNRELEEKQSTLVTLRAEVKSSYDFANMLLAAADAAEDGSDSKPPVNQQPAVGPAANTLNIDPLVPAETGAPRLEDPDPRPSETELALQNLRQRLTVLESDAALRRAAQMEVVRRIGAEAVNGLIDSLESPRAEVRAWACDALADLGTDAADAVPALRLLANDADPEVRIRAAVALQAIVD